MRSQAGWVGLEVLLRDCTWCPARGAGDEGQRRAFPWDPGCVEGMQEDRERLWTQAGPFSGRRSLWNCQFLREPCLVFIFSCAATKLWAPAVTQVVIHSSSSRDLENRRIPDLELSPPAHALAFPGEPHLAGGLPCGFVRVVSAQRFHLTPLNHAPAVPFVRFPLH